MKKKRGLRRYYRNLAIQNDFKDGKHFDYIRNDPDVFYDLWHWHFDWSGFGNNSFKRRKPHLDKLFRHFEMFIEAAQWMKKDFQLFALILDKESSADCIFIHTPNPNINNFPLTWDNLSEECTLKDKNLIGYLDQLTGYEKLYGVRDEPFCILVKKGVGLDKMLYRVGVDGGNYMHG